MSERRVVLILSGGDWSDASVEDLEVPAELDLVAAHAEWSEWYRGYCIELRLKKNPVYQSFSTWLIREKGCKPAELEQF